MTFAARHIGPDADAQTQMLKAIGYASLEALMAALTPPRVVWLMVPSGAPVDETLRQLTQLAAPGDIFVDGGNLRVDAPTSVASGAPASAAWRALPG